MSDEPKKRGRPRKPDSELKRPRVQKEEQPAEVELEVATIEVGDTRAALSLLDEATREEIDRESKRAAMAAEIAKHRWTIAQNFHCLADGKSKLDFISRPFLEELYKDDGTDTVVIGSAQYGKTELAICDAVATAGICGLPLIWVISKQDKRDRFVKNRIDPCFNTVPFYKKLFEAARERNANADSNSVKHFGAGSLNFLYATASREFTTIDAGKAIVDEHQECDPDNIARLHDRLSGHLWAMKLFLGHPSSPGTESNQNLDWLYRQGDHREWYVPCPHCKEEHILQWAQHVVHEVRNEHGALLEVRPRDEEYRPGPNALDMRPICSSCHRPMNRLSRMGFWKKRQPERSRHSYRLSNIYNVNVRLDTAFNRYVAARHRPHDMAEFYNKYLGICYSLSGTKIDETMLDNCSSGENSGIAPYKFIPVTEMEWKRVSRL